MQLFNYKHRFLAVALIVLVVTFATGVYLYNTISRSADDIIESNKSVTLAATNSLTASFETDFQNIWEQHLAGKDGITKGEERVADSLASIHVREVLSRFQKVEGGLYFFKLDSFIGYGYPSLDPPKPAFGPPPRSYEIIRSQVRESIRTNSEITELHRFDPAIFPLTTNPIYFEGEIVGSAWSRVHIERELSRYQTIQSGTFFLTVGIILFALTLAVYTVYVIMRQLQEMKQGLETMKKNPEYRLKKSNGIFGYISNSINEMIDIQQSEQKKNQHLERELYQKEKMASLGNLIAGAAHEINTPISIIKTRIQLWHRKYTNPSQVHGEGDSQFVHKSLSMIQSEVERVSKLVKKLLYFSKPIGLKSKLELNQLITKQVQRLSKHQPEKNIEFELKLNNDIPMINADVDAIEQVLTNVIKNAIEASPATGTINICTRLRNKDEAEIFIKDQGSGLPKKETHRLFDPFYTTKENGSGLGLSISNEIIKAHHGKLYFQVSSISMVSDSILSCDPENNFNVLEQDSFSGTVCIIVLPIDSSTT